MSNINERPPPSTTAVAVATALIAGVTGYFLGQASSLGLFKSKAQPTQETRDNKKASGEDSEETESDEDWEVGQEQGDINSFTDSNEECKLVLVVRTDLGMTKGMLFSPRFAIHATCFLASSGEHQLTQAKAKSQPNAPTQPSPATKP